jgi:hypothetical protein
MFGGLATHAYLSNDWRWESILMFLLVPLSIAGLVDAITARVELREDELVIVKNFRTRNYSRRLFTKVTAEKGVPIALQTVDGHWVKLPDVSPGGQGLVNKLRAWVKHQRS